MPQEEVLSSVDDESITTRVRVAVAVARQSPEASIEVELLADARPPGLTPFRAQLRHEEGETTGYCSGVVLETGEVVVDRARAIAAVLSAWRYDARQSVAPAEVARVVGFLLSDFAQITPFLHASELDSLRPEYQRLIAIPQDINVEGAPGVEFWVQAATDADLGPPLYRVRLIAPHDALAQVSLKQISDLR